MARKSSIESGSGFHDEFENPPAGPIGLHRGNRSMWVRVAPYIITVVIAVVLGLGVWLYVSGKGATLLGLGHPQTSSSVSATSSSRSSLHQSAKNDRSAKKSTASQSAGSSSDSSAQQGTKNDSDAHKSADQSHQQNQADQNGQNNQNDQNKDQHNNATPAADHSASILVYNGLSAAKYGSSRNGYANSQAQTLKNAGYTNVTAQTKSGYIPPSNVVWYANDADRGTAQDVASKMGIQAVSKMNLTDAKIEVVLVTK
jgi:cytoskeletal protein RodZ